MPGILPMKIIRVGSAAQSRIAQACDRCRSKKIRCDGIRPTCTQCSNVGFECKTSDKLSRRAFPRGYTESLEDRVRGLEAEVRELKDLLDEKDEKIDMLSRIHNFTSSPRKDSDSSSTGHVAHVKDEVESIREEILHVEIPAPVQPKAISTGSSTTPSFIEAFDQKLQESGQRGVKLSTTALLKVIQPSRSSSTSASGSKLPPRITSDQYITLFFQEWQPLLPILHRPTFLRVYEQYLSNPEAGSWQSSKQALAQLFLIFEISALSSMSISKKNTPSYESQWRRSLYSTSSDACLSSLQCHILAQICYLLRADYARLARHRGIAVTMCHELGLHQDHKYHSLSPLEAETKKKVFWSQYVLDKFISASIGTPMLLRDDDITTEYPADVDDENLSSEGVSPTLPGELTKISSALALFRVTRILSKVLDNLYPAKATYQLSLTKLHGLSDELDRWLEELPEHLRLRFCNDKPATYMTSCRSPLLSLSYFYTRSLIHRPLLCHGSGSIASASNIILAGSGKHTLQILDLLIERRMNYTFPLNKTDLLLTAGFSIIWQSLELADDSKLVKDNSKSLTLLFGMLNNENPVAVAELQKIAMSFMPIEGRPISSPNVVTQVIPDTSTTTALEIKSKSTRKQLQAIASKWSSFGSNKSKTETARSATAPQTTPPAYSHAQRAGSTASLNSTRSAPVVTMNTASPDQSTSSLAVDPLTINLDYMPLGNVYEDNQTRTSSSTMLPPKKHQNTNPLDASWDQLLNNYDSTNPAFYPDVSLNANALHPTTSNEWVPDNWNLNGMDFNSKTNVPQSLLSFSEESLTSGEDFVFSAPSSGISAPPSNNGSTVTGDQSEMVESYRGITIPVSNEFDYHEIDA